MSNLRDISVTMHTICKGMLQNSKQLYACAHAVGQLMTEIQNLLNGSSTELHTQLIAVLSQSISSINTAVKDLNFASEVGFRWVRNHFSGTSYEMRASATNSFGRSQMTDEEANVFIRLKSNLSQTMLSFLPVSRIEAVDSAYAKAPMHITALINHFSNRLQGILISGKSGGCWYSPNEHRFYMDEGMNHAEYTDVLKHEMGHFVDHMMGTPSGSPKFLIAMEQDRQKYETSSADGRMNMSDMLDDLFNTGACYDRNVTDILSALFRNDPMVLKRFSQESVTGYVAYYQHGDSYWDKCDTNGNSLNLRGKEIFANCFAIETDGYQISRDFVERWFPNVFAQMHEQLLGGNC